MEESRTNRVGKQHILEAAEKLFTEHGYKSTSIRDIAQASGVTNAALYYHFPDKEALFAEVMNLHAGRLSECMTAALNGQKSARERVKAIFLQYVHLVTSHQSPFFMIRRDPPVTKGKQLHGQFKKLMQVFFAPLEQVLEEAIQNGELDTAFTPQDVAAISIGMLHGLHQRRKVLGARNQVLTEKDVDLIVETIWKGFAKD